MKCPNPKCGKEVPKKFVLHGSIYRDEAGQIVFDLFQKAGFFCPECETEYEFDVDLPDDHPMPTISGAVLPDVCPECHAAIGDVHDVSVDCDCDNNTIDAATIFGICPKCYADIGEVYRFATLHLGDPFDLIPPRICRVCGCTDDHACEDDDGEPCAWVDGEDICTACMSAEVAAGESDAEIAAAKPLLHPGK